jgi:hypothetical protein
MIFSSKTERFVFDTLKAGPNTVANIVKKNTLGVTQEAIYLAIRNLIKDGLVVKTGKRILLNLMILEQFSRDISSIQKNYSEKGQIFKKILDKGEIISYRFNSFQELDNFWNHVWLELIPIDNIIPGKWLTIDTTPYWHILYPKDVALFLDLVSKRKYSVFLAFDSAVHIPPKVITDLRTKGVQVAFKKTKKSHRAYNVFDDIIVEVDYPKVAYEQIYQLFIKPSIDSQKIKGILLEMSPYKVKIYKNKARADKFFAQYRNDFVYENIKKHKLK